MEIPPLKISPFQSIPEFAMKPEERVNYLAEQQFLLKVLHKFHGEKTTDKASVFYDYVVDISSTEIALLGLSSYGIGGKTISSGEIAKNYDTNADRINNIRRTLIQTLRLLHPKVLDNLLDQEKQTIESRYPTELVKGDGDVYSLTQIRTYERAMRNITYYRERLWIQKHESEILEMMRGMYGMNKTDIFSQYYRLGLYTNEDVLERRGCLIVANNHLEIERALESGRVISEYIIDVEVGKKSWQTLRGLQAQPYRHQSDRFRSVLHKHLERVQALNFLNDKEKSQLLNPSQRQLLQLALESYFDSQSYSNGINKFNRTHGMQYGASDVKSIISRLFTQISNTDPLRNIEIARKIGILVQDTRRNIYQTFLEKLTEISVLFHDDKLTYAQIAETLGTDISTIAGIKRLIDRMMDFTQNSSSSSVLLRGEWKKEQIEEMILSNSSFGNNIKELLCEMALPESKLLNLSTAKKFRIPYHYLVALRSFISYFVEQNVSNISHE
ncbi:MAG: hypothetical protein WCO06_06655 [Candidatus Roizmanbacteria bacterium]